jgi:hypothetical protein
MNRIWIQLVALLPLGSVTILIANGKATPRRGRPRSVLLSELSQLAQSNGIHLAAIHASAIGKSGYRLSLFGIPKRLHQRFRNVWAANWK